MAATAATVFSSSLFQQAAVAVGAAVAGPAIARAVGLGGDRGGSNPMLIEQGKPPGLPDTAKAAEGARAQQQKRAVGAQGTSSTNKTGPQGLGEIGSQNVERKTLLGY